MPSSLTTRHGGEGEDVPWPRPVRCSAGSWAWIYAVTCGRGTYLHADLGDLHGIGGDALAEAGA